jgi:hypothetical protein
MNRSNGSISVAFALLAYALSTATAVIVAPLEIGTRPWRAYDLVVLRNAEDLHRARERLVNGGETPIDRVSATVTVEDFLGGETIPVATLAERFDPADPRYDPFLRSVGALFTASRAGQRVELLYLPRTGSMVDRYRTLRQTLSGIPYTYVGINILPALVAAVGALAAMAFVLRTRYVPWWTVALAIPAIVAYAFTNGAAGLVRAVLVGSVWTVFVDRRADRDREFFVYGRRAPLDTADRFSIAILALSVIAAALTIPATDAHQRVASIASFVAFLGALSAITLAWYLIHRSRIRRSEHRLFVPQPILGGAFRSGRERRAPLIGAIPFAYGTLLVALAAVFLVGGRASGDVFVPVPAHIAMEPDTESGTTDVAALIEATRAIVPTSDAVSTAGLIAHRWYHTGLIYGATYRVPSYQESIELTRYVETENGIRSMPTVVATFDDRWVADHIDGAPGSVYRMLLEEGGVFVVRPDAISVPSLGTRLTVRLLVAILVCLVPVTVGPRFAVRGALDTVTTFSKRERQSA